MKKNLHPEIKSIEITCTTCGNNFELKTTVEEIKVDVCSNCHPFYTGKQTSGSKTGRVDKFNKRMEKIK
ncbi:MAG: 50S ribosomal protein L31 [Mycoplasmataceae bacterium]|nr:50S ribosomal protein L31 [Mycoplasmataceae bacterium]